MLSVGRGISFTSLNCKELNYPIKCSKDSHHLHHLDAQIGFCFIGNSDLLITIAYGGDGLGKFFTLHSRAAIMFHKSVPFIHLNNTTDPNGRFIIVISHTDNLLVILTNIYAPNW